MKSQSRSSKIKGIVQGIEGRIRRVFNTDFFSLYEGIIEKIDIINGVVNVRIPELNDVLFTECRVMTLCSSDTASITPSYKLGTHVIVGFRQFSLNYPVILGQISPQEVVYNPFDYREGVMNFKSGNSAIRLAPDEIVFTCGESVVIISESGIRLNGSIVTANGEDLTYDERSKDDD